MTCLNALEGKSNQNIVVNEKFVKDIVMSDKAMNAKLIRRL